MGIEGDDVVAILKALQLDVGFVHQFMNVGYAVQDARHATFWLNHCGALVDTEPMGEGAVVRMCHHIEDPTFDATAVATNPRARIRPLHRPPRVPAGRLPHCHWTIAIDPDVEPVVESGFARQMRATALAALPNEMPADREPGGWRDYRGAFDPEFRLDRLSHGALVAALREFQVQMHLLVASTELVVAARLDRAFARDALSRQWAAVAWIVSERLRSWRGGRTRGLEGLAELIALHPALPPLSQVDAEIRGDSRIELRVTPPPSLLDPDEPGWAGLFASGDSRGIEALVQGFDPRARVAAIGASSDTRAFAIDVDPTTAPAQPPASSEIIRMSGAVGFQFH
jgi:hypothetical protein